MRHISYYVEIMTYDISTPRQAININNNIQYQHHLYLLYGTTTYATMITTHMQSGATVSR